MKIKIFLITAVMCLMSGCGAVQVSERMYVQMMGVSEEEGECVLCVQAVETKSAPDEAPVYEYYEGRGATFRQAAADIEAENGRQLFFGHCTLLVLDGDFLSSGERLKMLMGERISPGCRVCCSDVPGAALSREGEDGLIGADVISGEIDRLAARGQFWEVTLKEVCEFAEKGEAFLMPAAALNITQGYDEKSNQSREQDPGNMTGSNVTGSGEIPDHQNAPNINGGVIPGKAISAAGGTVTGCGAVYGSDIHYLNMDETVIAGLIRGESGAELPVQGGTLRADKVKSAVYFQTGENILNISLDISGTMTELSDGADLSLCRQEAEEMLSGALTRLCESDSIGITTAVAGVSPGEGAFYNCHANVNIVDNDSD